MARLDRRVAGHPLSALLSHRVSRLRARTVCPIGDLAGGSEPAELGGNASFVQLNTRTLNTPSRGADYRLLADKIRAVAVRTPLPAARQELAQLAAKYERRADHLDRR